jgi:hypothetical protein
MATQATPDSPSSHAARWISQLSLIMASFSPHEACIRLAKELKEHYDSDRRQNPADHLLITSLVDAVRSKSLELLMPAVWEYIHAKNRLGAPDPSKAPLFRILADTTREIPFWRPLFGVAVRPDKAANLAQQIQRSSPDSVLEVARRVVLDFSAVPREQLRDALRIIANTCADNNANRSIIVNRDGIGALLELLRNRKECDLVIPVLYNVCVDYDEPATDSDGNPMVLPKDLQ